MGGHVVYLSLGSNLGDRKGNCEKALREIEGRHVGNVTALSPFYMTEPVDFTDQDWFVNAAACIETRLEPPELLKELKLIQKDLGTMEKTVRFGPRTIDLDILLFDDLVQNWDDLVIPHERMHQRAFVLVPLCDIAPHKTHPVSGKTMKELLETIDTEHQDVKPLTKPTGEHP
jgi:2-amino-4-hydroxy-6-hydroxymethyldihydropteridine diphosphokinase